MKTLNNSEGSQYKVESPYDTITNEARRALVKLVTEKGLSVRKASRLLKIKYTTAKALVQRFRATGNIDR